MTNVRGELQGRVGADAQVVMRPCTGGAGASEVAHVDAGGSFEFRGLESGCYQVSVVTLTGTKLYEGTHDVGRSGEGLNIRLRQSEPERPVTGSVSVVGLRPKPPKKAMRMAVQAATLSAKGDHAGAVELLREAVRMHPPFAEAHINLGAQYARLGNYREALEEFDQARLLGVRDAALWTNIGAAHVGLHNALPAQAAVDEALKLKADYPQARYIAGQVCLMQGKADEAIRHLERSVDLPAGRILLAQVYAKTGRPREASVALRGYLETGHASYRSFAERMLRELK